MDTEEKGERHQQKLPAGLGPIKNLTNHRISSDSYLNLRENRGKEPKITNLANVDCATLQRDRALHGPHHSLDVLYPHFRSSLSFYCRTTEKSLQIVEN